MDFQNICNEMVAPFLLRHPVGSTRWSGLIVGYYCIDWIVWYMYEYVLYFNLIPCIKLYIQPQVWNKRSVCPQSCLCVFLSRGSKIRVMRTKCDPAINLGRRLGTKTPKAVKLFLSAHLMQACQSCVKCGSIMSRLFVLSSGLRQGGVLSPYFFRNLHRQYS